MAHLASRTGTAAAGGVRLWALDNEPMLWNSTHRDVHPAGATYDELWAKTVAIAAAIKAQDAGARSSAPPTGAGARTSTPARTAARPAPTAPRTAERTSSRGTSTRRRRGRRRTATRLLDVSRRPLLPAGRRRRAHERRVDRDVGAAAPDAQEPVRPDVRRRVVDRHGRRPGRLPDPADEGLDRGHYPGTKLAISEYNWGSDDGISGALAQAEALAIFGREGVDLATRWVAPADGLSHRGRVPPLPQLRRRGRAGGGRLRARDERERGRRRRVRAARRAGWKHALPASLQQGHLAQTVAATVAGGSRGPASLFRFTGSSRLAAAGSAAPAGGTLTLALPARSATLAVVGLPATPPPPAATSFHPRHPAASSTRAGRRGPRWRRTRAATSS